MPSSKKGIQGPRPNPLRITKDLYKTKKSAESTQSKPPAVFYEHAPKVIHASPQEFMGVVQQLTGRSSTSDSSIGFYRSQDQTTGNDDTVGMIDDTMLLLTLGRHQNLEKASSSVSPSLQFSSPTVVQYNFSKH
ncbi:VQ motif-containing family protein [Rhynchospora pubera]|uniref:VQ motif-containing family protein n=1 Tax=Rhynchospora pubera TaxID=906938 RepID=A0AAV8F5V7_9POAL|nr:VQ motif-containing family protein [Rhynchospora pubera]KAJ4807999.1 VQ motif-containing family protein [Rhynchospora pubera]